MEVHFFYPLAVMLVTFSVLTVAARNPVRSAIYLISALLATAGLFLLLKAEFVTAVQILVYVGGIMVLFLFVIMLVSVREVATQVRTSHRWKTGLVLTGVLSTQLIVLIFQGANIFETGSVTRAVVVQEKSMNTQLVGELLYSTYLLPFEITSVVLLVAMVGAVVLAKKEI